MTQKTYEEYQSDLLKFLSNHDYDYRVVTSSMFENRWHKNYICCDGSEFTEINEIITEEAEVAHRGLIFKTNVKMLRTEYWSTDCSNSCYVYQKA